jgi:uncharacterized delta-60 repeat protein
MNLGINFCIIKFMKEGGIMKNLSLKSLPFVLAVVLSLAFAQDSVWVERFLAGDPWTGNPCHSRGHAVAFDGQENVYVHAQGTDWLTWSFGMLIKYSTNGNLQWAYYATGYNEYWEPNAIFYNPGDNTIALAGSEWDGGANPNNALRAYKYDANGTRIWRARYREYVGFAEDVVMDDSGNVYVVGSTGYDFGQYSAIIIRYNTAGTGGGIGISEWSDKYKGSSTGPYYINVFTGIVCDSDGYIYATGYCADEGTGYNFVTIKYNPQTGSRIWIKKFEGNLSDYAHDVTTDNTNNIYVAGRSSSLGTGYTGILVIKYTSSGDTVWTGKCDISGSHFTPWGMAVDNSGNVYVTGDVSHSRAIDAFILKFTADGEFAWVKYFNGSGNGTDQAKAIALDKAGNVYISGETDVAGMNNDYFTIKYDPAGDTIWTALYDGPGNGLDGAYDIVVDDSNYAYVTGVSDGGAVSGTYDCTTIKYKNAVIGVYEQLLRGKSNLLTIFPNPFNDKTNIRYNIGQNTQGIELKIYDATGSLVKSFNLPTPYSLLPTVISWNGKDNYDRILSAGIYFCELQCGEEKEVKKLIMIR